jgi:hypothetical protein
MGFLRKIVTFRESCYIIPESAWNLYECMEISVFT